MNSDSGIYVEIHIRAPMDELWAKTQKPEQHQHWDLRFTEIQYLHRPDVSQPQRFLYSTRIGFGLKISGEGETVGSHDDKGMRTSALRFWSGDPKSLIREGSGYWQYIPEDRGVKFLTWYDYTTRFGVIGRVLDFIVFRPLIGWATAWSFDRLRLWLEQEIAPSVSLRQSIIYGISRIAVAFVWIYHGLVPKLIFSDPDEVAMLMAAGVPSDQVAASLRYIGWGETAFGLTLLAAWKTRSLFVTNILFMVVALVVVAFRSPHYLLGAFNPVTLNTAIIALSIVGFLSGKDIPSAGRCKRRKREGT